VYWEESGASDGIPALYLHGGPGSGLGSGGYVDRFDPTRYRVIGLEQRGCGRSVPCADHPEHDLAANTTTRLIADIDLLRTHLGVDAWVLNGVSWGSTLALAYAQAHPDRVLGIVLMAVTTTARAEVDWITETVGALYPEAWERLAAFAESAGIGYRRGEGRVVDAYAQLLRSPATRDAAARAWMAWEDAHVAIGSGSGSRPVDAQRDLVIAILVTHYWSHDAFLDPPILARMGALAHIPGYLIHGRLDVSGPPITPWRLHRAWPASTLLLEEHEGHGGPRMVQAWTDANSRLADRLR
jgi:proline iminopeptidase